MRGSGRPHRAAAMTLLLTCVMALWPTLLPVHRGSEGGAALVLTDSGVPSALPAPGGGEAFDGIEGPHPKRDGRADGGSRLPDPFSTLPDPTPPEGHPIASGAALLGLLAAPANAPPLG